MNLKKTISPVLGIGIVLVLSIFAYLFLSYAINRNIAQSTHQDANQVFVPTVSSKASDKIEVKTLTSVTIGDTPAAGTSYEVTHEYVQLKPLATDTPDLKKVKQGINTLLEKKAQKAYDLGVEQMKENVEAFDTMPTASSIERHLLSTVEVEKSMTYLNEQTGVFSYVISVYEDSGGAHGTGGFISETFDLATGKELEIYDFINKADYKDAFQKEVVEQIKTQASTCLRCEYLSDIDVTDWDDFVTYQHFALAPNGLTLLFGAYELGPYAATAAGQEIFVSKETIRDIVVRQW